ncbi:MAG: hypothetical protein WC570_00410 [Patescibacteria group bacterium]
MIKLFPKIFSMVMLTAISWQLGGWCLGVARAEMNGIPTIDIQAVVAVHEHGKPMTEVVWSDGGISQPMPICCINNNHQPDAVTDFSRNLSERKADILHNVDSNSQDCLIGQDPLINSPPDLLASTPIIDRKMMSKRE